MEQDIASEVHLARGDAAAQLLTSDCFMAVTNELVNSYVAEFVGSKTLDKETREAAYVRIKVVQDLVGVLNQWQSTAHQIRIAADEEHNED